MDKIDWKPLNTAPYNKHIVVLLEDGTVHSAKKIVVESVMFPGTKDEKFLSQDEYAPLGVYATYDAEPYYLVPIKWTDYLNLF